MRSLLTILVLAGLVSCQRGHDADAPEAATEAAAPQSTSAPAAVDASGQLADLLNSRPDFVKARYAWRHPQETIEFFEIKPGMTVVETLPGNGWYTAVLLPYLGSSGHLIGADYAYEMWPMFGFFGEDFIAAKTTWVKDWPVEADAWRVGDSADVMAFVLGSMPPEMAGTADRVFMVRTLHNLARFEKDGGFLTKAIADAYAILKPGGLVGIVQHEAREDKSDEWASGARGYLKKSFVIEQMTKGGFELVGESAINENPADQPGDDDVVWRLPPTYAGAGDDIARKNALDEIGESNRMTLKFRKPE